MEEACPCGNRALLFKEIEQASLCTAAPVGWDLCGLLGLDGSEVTSIVNI